MAAVASVTAKAEIELTEGLSLQGFLDVSAQRADDGKDTDSTAEIGEFEVDFLYDNDSINAQVDLNYTDSSGGVMARLACKSNNGPWRKFYSH